MRRPASWANRRLKHLSKFSKQNLLIVILVFAAIGGYVLLRSFAATAPVTTKIIDPDDTGSFAGTFDISATITIGTGSSATAKGVTFKVDGTAIGPEVTSTTDGTTFTFSNWNSQNVSNGVHNLTVLGRDTAGNTDSDTYNFLVDNTKPTVSLNDPGSTLSGTVNLTTNVTDNIGVTWVHFILIDPNCPAGTVQGNPLIPGDDQGCLFLAMAQPASAALARNGTVTASWDTTKVPNGAYTIKAIAYDAGGEANQVASNTVSVTINNPGSTLILGDGSVVGSALYKNVYQVDEQWNCPNGGRTYDSVTVLMLDKPAKAFNASNADAVHPGGCANMTINQLNIVQYFGDAIKGGGSNNTINSGIIRCYDRMPIYEQT